MPAGVAGTYPLLEKEGAEPVTYPDAAHRQGELPRKIVPGQQPSTGGHSLGHSDDAEHLHHARNTPAGMPATTTYAPLEKEGAEPVSYPDAAHRRDELPSRMTPKERLVQEQERIRREGPVVDGQTQQTANTTPDATGSTSEDVLPTVPTNVPRGIDAETGEKLSFKEKVAGYAKHTAGVLTGNDREKAQGEAALRGVDVGQKHAGHHQH